MSGTPVMHDAPAASSSTPTPAPVPDPAFDAQQATPAPPVTSVSQTNLTFEEVAQTDSEVPEVEAF